MNAIIIISDNLIQILLYFFNTIKFTSMIIKIKLYLNIHVRDANKFSIAK